jgi:hypothetical protein
MKDGQTEIHTPIKPIFPHKIMTVSYTTIPCSRGIHEVHINLEWVQLDANRNLNQLPLEYKEHGTCLLVQNV